jgi:hypothetical protein
MEDYLVIRPWVIFERDGDQRIFFGAEDGMWVWELSVEGYPRMALRKFLDLEQAYDKFYELEREGWSLKVDNRSNYDEC